MNKINLIKNFLLSHNIENKDFLIENLNKLDHKNLEYIYSLIFAKTEKNRREIINNYVEKRKKKIEDIKNLEKKIINIVKKIEI
jgi:tRNA U34 5-carboxymethylaminomethyl modifying GTPase MnmE/TrmE